MNRNLYKETFEEITLPQNARDRLAALPERSMKMKRLPVKKLAVVLATAIVLCLGFTCYAALRSVRTDSETTPATLTHSYETLKEAQQETGLTFNCPEELDFGYSFEVMSMNDDTDYDENGEIIGTYKSVYAAYMDPDGNTIIYQISPLEEAASRTALTEAAAGSAETATGTDSSGNPVTLYYQTETYTGEDGSVSEQESVLWNDEENFYRISGYNLDLTGDQWFTLAKSLL